MAKKVLIDSILKLYSKLGGNVSEVLGTRSNISFLGTGKSPEGFIDSTINIDAIGALGKNKVLDELKSSMGYLTANKLNDLQAGKLYENMLKIDNVFNPKQIPNITDMATGNRDLTQEGLGFLRATRKTDDDMRIIKDEVDLPEGVDPRDTILPMRSVDEAYGVDTKAVNKFMKDEGLDLPPPGSRGGPDDIAAPFESTGNPIEDFRQFVLNKKGGSNEITALETMTKNKAGTEFITGYVDDVYKNSGVTASVDVAKKRAAAREFLFTMLKKETDLLPQGGTLESVINPTDYKYIMEGGGGALGDPLILVKKYFGDEIARRLPLNSDREIIETFVDNVRFTKDRAGFATDDPRFNPDDIPEFKHGGLAKILEV